MRKQRKNSWTYDGHGGENAQRSNGGDLKKQKLHGMRQETKLRNTRKRMANLK